MLEYLRKHKVLFLAGGVGLCVVLLFAIPLFINLLFKIPAPNELFCAQWQADDALSYYGSVLSFLGTGVLSILALWQNQKINEINEQHTYLLERMEIQKSSPHFIIANGLITQNGLKMYFNINNVSNNVAQDVIVSDFILYEPNGKEYWSEHFHSEHLGILAPLMEKRVCITAHNLKSFSDMLTFNILYLDEFEYKHKITVLGRFSNNNQIIFTIKNRDLSNVEDNNGTH